MIQEFEMGYKLYTLQDRDELFSFDKQKSAGGTIQMITLWALESERDRTDDLKPEDFYLLCRNRALNVKIIKGFYLNKERKKSD